MIEITDEVYNKLEWKEMDISHIDEELEGYAILGADTCFAWARPGRSDAVDAVTLYLQAPGSDVIKIVNIDAEYIYLQNEEQESELFSPIQIDVAYIKLEEA